MKRIQRSRARGWRMPEGAVYVGRPSRWGNPWRLGSLNIAHQPDGSAWTAEDVTRWYRQLIQAEFDLDPSLLAPLRGRDLVCWCPLSAPCHADVLLELANR